MSDLTSEELDRLYEGSKDDRYIIVGSEVRQMIGMIRRSKDAVFQAKVEAAYELAAEISKSKQLEAALREIAEWPPSTEYARDLARYEVATARITTLEEMMRLVMEDLGWSERDRTRTQLLAALAPEQDK